MNDPVTSSIFETIPGGTELLNWFGCEPSFHDAEILELHLRRTGNSVLTIHTWIMSNSIQEGFFLLERHAIVTFSLGRIISLELDGFNHQNVIGGLSLERVSTGENPAAFELELKPSYGASGFIQAEEISVDFVAGRP